MWWMLVFIGGVLLWSCSYRSFRGETNPCQRRPKPWTRRLTPSPWWLQRSAASSTRVT